MTDTKVAWRVKRGAAFGAEVRRAHARGEDAVLTESDVTEYLAVLAQLFPTSGIDVRVRLGKVVATVSLPLPAVALRDGYQLLEACSVAPTETALEVSGSWFRKYGAALLAHAARPPRDARQDAVYTWVRGTFGEGCAVPAERAARLFEEVAELCQVEDVPMEDLARLLDHVYSKPVGEAAQELGGVGTTLLAYAASRGLSADAAESEEVARVLAKDPEYFRGRQTKKADAGVARSVDTASLSLEPNIAEVLQRAEERDEERQRAVMVCGPEPHRSCRTILGTKDVPLVCACDCRECRRAWFEAGRPIVRGGKIVTDGSVR